MDIGTRQVAVWAGLAGLLMLLTVMATDCARQTLAGLRLLSSLVDQPWSTVYSSDSPDRQSRVLVQERACFADCTVRVVIQQGGGTVEVATKHDCSINFAHAARGGTQLAVFVDGGFCGPIEVGYDVAKRRVVEFAGVRSWLADSIVRSYGVGGQELRENRQDVFQWATHPGDGNWRRSTAEFDRRFSERGRAIALSNSQLAQ